jgi:hypothetical protein
MKMKRYNSKLMHILIILAIGIFIVSCNTIPQKTADTKINTQFPDDADDEIVIEQDDTVAASYGPECADKNYWDDNADWIVEMVVEDVKEFDVPPQGISHVSTSIIKNYVKGTPVADKFIFKHYSGYSTSGDMDILLKEGNMVRAYLIDAYKVTGLEEHKGEFGFVCQGVEEIK